MTKTLLIVLSTFILSLPSLGQCPAGMNQGKLDWDYLEFFPSNGLGSYTNIINSQTQHFSLGANRVTMTHNYTGSNAPGENADHTGSASTYGTNEDLRFMGNGTITMSFASAVQNLQFSLYDIDRLQTISFSALNGVTPVNVGLTTVGSSIITLSNNNTPTASAAASDVSVGDNSNNAAFNVDIAGPVTSVTITITNTKVVSNGAGPDREDGGFWLSDIIACSGGSFPVNYYAISQPFTGQPGYVLAVRNNNVYYVDPATGRARFLFQDPGHTNINSMAYDPVNKLIYYTYSLSGGGGGTNPNNKALRRYDYNMDTFGVVVNDITTLRIPTFDVGVESGAAAFYNGSLYIGIEASNSGPYESIIWKLDFNSSFAPTTVTQQYGVNGSGHDWADIGINNGILYDYDGYASGPDFFVVNLLSNGITSYTPASGVIPRQTGVDWNGVIYNIGPPGSGTTGSIVPYNNTNGVLSAQQQQITYNGVAVTGSWGDAAEAFKPKADFGDAPASYDPVGSDPAVHEHDNNLYLGSLPSIEWTKRGQTAAADSDTDDGLPTVTILKQSGGYLITTNVYNNTGADATVCAWVDFNADGVFTSDEGVSVTVPTSGSVQSVNIFWASASTDLPNNSYTMLRLRVASAAYGMGVGNPTGYFYNGEVEDYRILVDSQPLSNNIFSFNAHKQAKQVKLDWVITDELLNTRYDLERSSNSQDWVTIHSKSSQARSLRSVYNYTDEQPLNGVNYYRLKISRTNRASVYSNIKRVDIDNEVLITIHPNPVITVAKLNIQQDTDAMGELVVVDAGGSIIYRQDLQIRKGVNQFDLPLGEKLSNGVYQTIVSINNQSYINKLLIKK